VPQAEGDGARNRAERGGRRFESFSGHRIVYAKRDCMALLLQSERSLPRGSDHQRLALVIASRLVALIVLTFLLQERSRGGTRNGDAPSPGAPNRFACYLGAPLVTCWRIWGRPGFADLPDLCVGRRKACNRHLKLDRLLVLALNRDR